VAAVNAQEGLYAERYPLLKDLRGNLVNHVWRNVAVETGALLREPTRIDAAGNWVAPRGGMEVMDRRMCFAPLPVNEMGLYEDAFRGDARR
jgi:hypothetical protein